MTARVSRWTNHGKALALILIAVAAGVEARDVELRAPLTTIIAAERPPDSGEGALSVIAELDVPADAPRDLGVGAFVADRHGRWWQRAADTPLSAGRQVVRIAFAAVGDARSEPDRARWEPPAAARSTRGGLFLWSASTSRAVITVRSLVCLRAAPTASRAHRLLDLACDGMGADGLAHARTGERWSLRVRAAPVPDNPYDPDRFRLDAVVVEPDGTERRLAGFWSQPMRGADRGDGEAVLPDGSASFVVRFRPRLPGRHHVRLEATWRDGAGTALVRCACPPLEVGGARWDAYARVDAKDPRFFSIDGAFWWPIAINLRSVSDERCQKRLRTKLTLNRGALSYDAYLPRFAAGGGDAIELWLCSWNLALEWRGDWPGYQGIGRYSDENAWRLDRVLDAAWANGVRVNLVIANHGQASERTDREWDDSPYNRANGGRLDSAAAYFVDPWALAQQDKLRRYLVARYADHPAIMAWKLWSEVNLTAGEQQAVRAWHEVAERRWHELDIYGHPVTTHWSGDFQRPDPAILAQPDLDFACIDAYHTQLDEGGWLLAELLHQGMHQTNHGLGRFRKPILVTEYGGNWNACPPAQLVAEHATSAWAALVSGYGGAPLLWWFEWVDQGARWAPYGAIRRFLAGEDPRGADAKTIEPLASTPFGELWVKAWSQPGRMLGYVLDRRWGAQGGSAVERSGVRIDLGSAVVAGQVVIEWWDADRGVVVADEIIAHPGGALSVAVPPFQGHIAFKVSRR